MTFDFEEPVLANEGKGIQCVCPIKLNITTLFVARFALLHAFGCGFGDDKVLWMAERASVAYPYG